MTEQEKQEREAIYNALINEMGCIAQLMDDGLTEQDLYNEIMTSDNETLLLHKSIIGG